jgi:exonuclease III
MTEMLRKSFKKNLIILNLMHPDTPQATAGMSFIINKQLVEPEKIEMSELIPGRAAMLKMKWLKSCSAILLNIYALNNRGEHMNFWAKIMMERWAKHLPIPDLTMGNFNVMEDAIDRMPPNLDDKSVIAALREVRHTWDIRDTWCQANLTENAFMYKAQMWGKQIQAQLDCIYVSKKAEPCMFDWDIMKTAILTDHTMVSICFAPKDALQMGKGRWPLPLSLLNNDKLLEKLADQDIILQSNLTRD